MNIKGDKKKGRYRVYQNNRYVGTIKTVVISRDYHNPVYKILGKSGSYPTISDAAYSLIEGEEHEH